MTVATGFNFDPLPDATVLIELFGDGGKTVNKQKITLDVMCGLGLVSAKTDVALKKGPEVAKVVMSILLGTTATGHL